MVSAYYTGVGEALRLRGGDGIDHRDRNRIHAGCEPAPDQCPTHVAEAGQHDSPRHYFRTRKPRAR